MDKVSIIVPVYNVEKYLYRTLSSLVGQTYQNLEILVIDDGSSDGSSGIIEDFAKKDSRIRPLYQENRGVSAARNRGLDAATGEWICFCDGDDWYLPEFVEKMRLCAARENADYVVCDYRVASGGRSVTALSVSALESGCDPRRVVACGPLASCTHMIEKRLFDISGARYPEGVRQYEELPVIPVLAAYARRVGVCGEALYCYFQRGDGSSASNRRRFGEENFRKAFRLMADALGAGWEKELEFHAIYALFYGEILSACKEKLPAGQLRAKIRRFRAEYPHWRENSYLPGLGRGKWLFLELVDREWVVGLRWLAWIHGKIVN